MHVKLLIAILFVLQFRYSRQADNTLIDKRRTESDTCIAQCSFQFIGNLSHQMGQTNLAGMLDLNYNDLLMAFSNQTFFKGFCTLYQHFQYCHSHCAQGYLHELLMRSAEIVDIYCVYHYKAILELFPCLTHIDRNISIQCLKSCTPHHKLITSLMNNFRQLALNGDTSEAEQFLAESCEYVTCSMHCDVPTIAHLCSFETANLLINVTKKSFATMESVALDTGAISKWPTKCADIRNYMLPTQLSTSDSNNSSKLLSDQQALTSNSIQLNANSIISALICLSFIFCS